MKSGEIAARAIPITIVTGFLGSGKTTLINRILNESNGARIAVIVNEFGALGIDGAILSDGPGRIVELANGCMCCESRGNLVGALGDLAAHADSIDAVIVETSGIADPFGVGDVIIGTQFEVDYVLAAVITVLDAENFDANLNHAEAAYRQIACADLFFLSKTDLAPEGTAGQILSRIRGVNPTAAAVDGGQSRIHEFIDFAVPATRASRDNPFDTTMGPGLQSFSWRSSQPVDANVLASWVAALPPDVVRVKALLVGRGGNSAVHRVGSRTTVSKGPNRADELNGDLARVVLFAPQIDEHLLTSQLRSIQEDSSED